MRPPTAWACSRKLLDTLASIKTGAPTISISMYVRNSSKATSRSPSSAPCATAWETERDARTACVAAKYEMSIFEEDLDLQRRALSGLEFPLDVAAELHTRADRVAVEFRRVLAAAVSA